MDPFIGQIMPVGFNFAPTGWALCNGQVLPISQNTALFSILGTTYGGDGRTTFALPDLRGRAPVQQGAGPGLSPVNLGQMAGQQTVTLLTTQMPAHTHTAPGSEQACATVKGTQASPVGAYPAVSDRPLYGEPDSGKMAVATTSVAGGGQPHNNVQPYLGLNFIIALQGIYPSRS